MCGGPTCAKANFSNLFSRSSVKCKHNVNVRHGRHCIHGTVRASEVGYRALQYCCLQSIQQSVVRRKAIALHELVNVVHGCVHKLTHL